MAEDSYLNWQLCHAWFCYKSNISFIQALCTNLQLGNMNVFIHCVLAFSNHPDSNLKSWTGKVGSGSLRLRSDPRCPGLPRPGAAEELPGDTGAPRFPSHVPHQVSGWVLQSFHQSCSQFLVGCGVGDAECPSQGWVRHRGQWPEPAGTSSRRPEASRFMGVWNGTSAPFASRMACKVFSFPCPHLREKSYKTSKKFPWLKMAGLFQDYWSECSLW